MSLLALAKTNLIISNREAVNAVVSYILYVLMSLLLVGAILGSIYSNDQGDSTSAIIVFVSSLLLYDYFLIQAKLHSRSLIDRLTFALFPVSRLRSLSIRFFLILVDKRIFFYLLPLLGVLILLATRSDFVEMLFMLFLFTSMYLVISEFVFLLYSLLRKIADRFSVRAATQFSAIPFVLFFLSINALARGNTNLVVMTPVVSQFTKGFRAILTSDAATASIEVGLLFLFFISIALTASAAGSLFDRVALHKRLRFDVGGDMRVRKNSGPLTAESAGKRLIIKRIEEKRMASRVTVIREDPEQGMHIGWHLVFVDWLVHQREEKILFLLLLYPLMAIFAIIRMVSRLHFDPGSLILPIFFITQILGVYFTENHFTGHGLRLSHIVLTPVNPFRFVFAKTISTWGLLSLMNVFVCLFCGVYLKLNIFTLAQGTIYSVFLPLVLLQLANTLSLYFPRISRHPLISLFIIVISELVLTEIYILIMSLSFFAGFLFVASAFYLSYVLSLPSWGRQLSKQIQVLFEVQR
jgi:hypothetical protein